MSENALVKALIKARANFAPISKTSQGRLGKYASLETILGAVTPALNAEGLDIGFTSEWESFEGDGDKVTTFKVATLYHTSGGTREARIEMAVDPPRMSKQGKEINNSSQMIGIASSYARRYALMDLLGIAPDEEDADRAPRRQREPAPRQSQDYPPRQKDTVDKAEVWVRDHLKQGKIGDVISGISKAIHKSQQKPNVGAVSVPQRRRLYAIAGQNGWKSDHVKAACRDLWNAELEELGWDVYPLVVAFFELADPSIHASEDDMLADTSDVADLQAELQGVNLTYKQARENIGPKKLPEHIHQLTKRQLNSVQNWMEVQAGL